MAHAAEARSLACVGAASVQPSGQANRSAVIITTNRQATSAARTVRTNSVYRVPRPPETVPSARAPIPTGFKKALSRDALRHVERHGHTLILRYAPEVAARVRQLVEQERRCCAFLQFDLQESADEVRLLVTAPPAAAEVVSDLLAELTGRQV